MTQWEKALDEKKETVVLGDINIAWLCCCSDRRPSGASPSHQAILHHQLVVATRFTKNIISTPRYVKKC